MLKIIDNMRQLNFSDLMLVYEESNLTSGGDRYPGMSEFDRLREAEQDFYQYLRSLFFKQQNARYAMWEENQHYVSAVRLEPYQDGLLLCALETAPDFRRKGYARKMLHALQEHLLGEKLYSHVTKINTASLELHKSCGFHTIKDYAAFIDGSISHDSVTMLYECKEAESM